MPKPSGAGKPEWFPANADAAAGCERLNPFTPIGVDLWVFSPDLH
jgi:hypothetical protein